MANEFLAGMDEEGLRKLLGELLASNRATQANFDEIRQQFPIQPENVANTIPTWEELEEGGLEPPEEGGEFSEQLGVGPGIQNITLEWSPDTGRLIKGGYDPGLGFSVDHPSTGLWRIRFHEPDSPASFQFPTHARALTVDRDTFGNFCGGCVNVINENGKRGFDLYIFTISGASLTNNAQFRFTCTHFV